MSKKPAKYSKYQIAITLLIWSLILPGIYMLVKGDKAGMWVIGAGLILGLLRAAYAYKHLPGTDTKEKRGGDR